MKKVKTNGKFYRLALIGLAIALLGYNGATAVSQLRHEDAVALPAYNASSAIEKDEELAITPPEQELSEQQSAAEENEQPTAQQDEQAEETPTEQVEQTEEQPEEKAEQPEEKAEQPEDTTAEQSEITEQDGDGITSVAKEQIEKAAMEGEAFVKLGTGKALMAAPPMGTEEPSVSVSFNAPDEPIFGTYSNSYTADVEFKWNGYAGADYTNKVTGSYSYKWSVNSEKKGTENTFEISNYISGVYTVRLDVEATYSYTFDGVNYTDKIASGYKEITLTILPEKPSIAASISGIDDGSELYRSDNTSLTGSAVFNDGGFTDGDYTVENDGSSSYTYSWKVCSTEAPGTAIASGSGASYTLPDLDIGSYTVELTVSGQASCSGGVTVDVSDTVSKSFSVLLPQEPTISAEISGAQSDYVSGSWAGPLTADVTIDPQGFTSENGYSYSDAAYTYLWKIDGAESGTGSTLSLSDLTSGDHTVDLTVNGTYKYSKNSGTQKDGTFEPCDAAQVTIKVDATEPTGSANYSGNSIIELADGSASYTLSGSAADTHSGVKTVEVSIGDESHYAAATLSGNDWTYTNTVTQSAAATTAYVKITDNVGNVKKVTVSTPTVLPELNVSADYTSTNALTGNATNNDSITLTYSANNSVTVTGVTVNGMVVESYDASGSELVFSVSDIKDYLTADSAIDIIVTLKDEADVSKIAECNSIIYRGPLTVTISQSQSITDSAKASDGNYYINNNGTAKNGSITVNLEPNYNLKNTSTISLKSANDTVKSKNATVNAEKPYASFEINSLSGFGDGAIGVEINAQDIYGQSYQNTLAPYTLTNIFYDASTPTLEDGTLFEVKRKGTAEFVASNGYVKAGDTVRLTFTLKDNYFFPETLPLKINNQSVTATAIVGEKTNAVTYQAQVVVSSGTDEQNLTYALSFADIAGIKGSGTVTGPVFFDELVATNMSIVDTAFNNADGGDESVADDGIVRNDDKVTVSFTTNHPVSVASKFGKDASDVTPVFVETPNGDDYTYTFDVFVPDNAADDLKTIPWSVTLNDTADNTAVSFGDTTADMNQLTYYMPLSLSDVEYITDNAKTKDESVKYAKEDDTVTVDFTANHKITIGSEDGSSKLMLNENSANTDNNHMDISDNGAVANSNSNKYQAVFTVDNANGYTDEDGVMFCNYELVDAAFNRLIQRETTAITKDTQIPVVKISTGAGETLGVDFTVEKTATGGRTVEDTYKKIAREGDTLTVDFYTFDNFSIRANTVSAKLGSKTIKPEENNDFEGIEKREVVFTVSRNSGSDDSVMAINFYFEDLAGNVYSKALKSDTKLYKPFANSFALRSLTTDNETLDSRTSCKAGDTVYLDIRLTHPATATDFCFFYGDEPQEATLVPSTEDKTYGGYKRFKSSITVPDDLDDLTKITYTLKLNDVVQNDEYEETHYTDKDNHYNNVWYYRPLGNGEGEIFVSDPAIITSSNKNDGTKYAKNDDWLYVDVEAGHEVQIVPDESSICTHEIIPSLEESGSAKYPSDFADNVKISRVCINNETIDQTPIFCTFTVMDPAGHTYTHVCDSETAYENENGVVIYYAPITTYVSIYPYGENKGIGSFVRNDSTVGITFESNHLTRVLYGDIMGKKVEYSYEGMQNEPYDARFSTTHHIAKKEQTYPEGFVSYYLSLDDVAGNTLAYSSTKGNDPKHYFVFYDRSQANVFVQPVIKGDGSEAAVNVRVEDLSLDYHLSSITVSDVTDEKNITKLVYCNDESGDVKYLDKNNIVTFNKSGKYKIDIFTKDFSRNPDHCASFNIEVEMNKDGYNVIIDREGGAIYGNYTELNDCIIVKNTEGIIQSCEAKLNGKEKLMEGHLINEKDGTLEIAAVTENGKDIHFTINGIKTVKFIGLDNDVLAK